MRRSSATLAMSADSRAAPAPRSRGRPPSLRSRLYLLIFFTALPAFVLVIYGDFEDRRLAALEAHAQNLEFARAAADKEESLVEITHLLLESLGQDIEDLLGKRASCGEFFEGFLGKYPRYADAGAVSPHGRVLCSARPAVSGSSVEKTHWFRSAMRSGKFAIGKYEFVPHAANAVLVFALPARNEEGRVEAVVYAMLDLGWLNRLVARSELPRGSNVSVVDRDGVILAHYPDPGDWVGKSARSMDLFSRVVLQGVTRAPGLDDTPRIYAFTELPSARGVEPVSVIVGIPEERVFAAANRTIWRNLGLLLLALAVSLSVGWWGSERVLVRPLRSLGETAQRLAEGELSARTRPPHGTRELHQLAAAFDTMAESLDEAEIERRRGELALKEEVAIASALAGASRELISTIDTQVLLERLCESVARALGSSWSQTYLGQPEKSRFQPVASWGVPGSVREPQRVLVVDRAQVAALERDDVITLDPAATAGRDAGTPHATIMCIALRRGPELVGFQSAGPWSEAAPPTRTQVRIAQGLSQLASLALANATLLGEVEAASRIKTDFLATMSHELRTPCHIIAGYLQLVMDQSLDPLTPKQIRALSKVHDNVQGLLELINTTLDLSRLESGRLSVVLEEVSLEDLLADIESEAEPLLREKPAIAFSYHVAPGLPTLFSDRGKLKVILKNLVNNAIKFTDGGRIEINAHAHHGAAAITVSDTGVGIAPELIPVVFEMFRQGDSSLNRKYGGAGLGLHIVKRMAELLGGSVSVASELHRGSTFTVRLPIDGRRGEVSRVA